MEFRRALRSAAVAVVAVTGPTAWAVSGEWVRSTGGTWWDSANWVDRAVPFAADDEAMFFDTVTSPATINVNGPVALGSLYVSNEQPLTFSGSGPLTLMSGLGDTFVGVEAGDHTIQAPLTLAGHAILHVLEPSVLTVAGPLSSLPAVEFAKVSSGSLRITGPQSYGLGSLFIAIEGTTTFATPAGSAANLNMNVENTAVVRFGASQRLADLRIGGGFVGEDVAPVAVIEANGGRVVRAQSLAMHETGTLDVSDNGLIIDASGSTRLAVLAEVERLIAMGRSGGTWQGKGLTSSAARSRPITGLAAMINDRGDGTPWITSFHGEAVGVNSVIVEHTYNGDANLDGLVDADDYFRIDSGFSGQPGNPTYGQGDLNYDNLVDADDYFLIDSAFAGQGSALGATMSLSAGVPEPGIAAVGFAGAWMALRRRRRQ